MKFALQIVEGEHEPLQDLDMAFEMEGRCDMSCD